MESAKTPSAKDEAIQLIQRLPDDSTLQDIQYHLYVRQKVEKALTAVDDGKGLTQEEAERRVSEWLRSELRNKERG